MLGYDYDGYVNLNYNNVDAVQQSSITTARYARTMRVFAGPCMFVAY